jgi:hypothetical protein
MISDYHKLREMMAENGFEHTPDEAKVMCNAFNNAMEKLTTYESYVLFRDMDEHDIVREVECLNRKLPRKDKFTLECFKEIRQFILDAYEGNF